jgi:hypothetical protein
MLFTLAVLGARQAAADVCVNVSVRFADHEQRPAVESMKDEASAIWKMYAVRLDWPATSRAPACIAEAGSLDVFVDRPRVRRPMTSNPVLGSTRVPVTVIDKAPIYVDQGATERVLSALTADQLVRLVGHSFLTQSDVGRALGRVLAHEIGHVLLGAGSHDARGLMRAVFPAGDLVGRERHFFDLLPTGVAHLREREPVLKLDWPSDTRPQQSRE